MSIADILITFIAVMSYDTHFAYMSYWHNVKQNQ